MAITRWPSWSVIAEGHHRRVAAERSEWTQYLVRRVFSNARQSNVIQAERHSPAYGEANPQATTVGGIFGYSHTAGGYDGGQAEYGRVPYADVGPTLIPDWMDPDDAVLLTDVAPTGYQAAESDLSILALALRSNTVEQNLLDESRVLLHRLQVQLHVRQGFLHPGKGIRDPAPLVLALARLSHRTYSSG
ncbi:hypothetical protein [Paracoccus sp. MC1854]|uniref:hypothetical protein n=1 Tax=Paracoccus sp. MC1854 TaxID=2760306 RepID=UPI001C724905|nr:hypothetical protein [Paracoccus sp. MC1854]